MFANYQTKPFGLEKEGQFTWKKETNQINLLGGINNLEKTQPDKNEGMKRIIEENRLKKFMERKQ